MICQIVNLSVAASNFDLLYQVLMSNGVLVEIAHCAAMCANGTKAYVLSASKNLLKRLKELFHSMISPMISSADKVHLVRGFFVLPCSSSRP